MLAILILPVPAFALDILLAFNIGVSVLILLVALGLESPLDFSVFPSLLLITTLFRLGLNVATTRLILLKGGEGAGAAGDVIETFGRFAVGGSLIVGAVVFLILLAVNFSVITKGSNRVAEVAARFTLDALARQADVDRRRSGRWPHRRSRRQARRAGAWSARSSSSARWTAPASSCAATRSPASSSRRSTSWAACWPG